MTTQALPPETAPASTARASRKSRLWRKHYAIPPEHGAWFWLLGPLVVGIVAAGNISLALVPLLVAALAAFLLRQPLTLLAKVWSGRRGRADAAPALVWSGIYGIVAAAAVAVLVRMGHGHVLALAVPGVPIFLYFLWLVSRKEERGQRTLEILGASVLALTAPAAYWTCGGDDDVVAGTLWIIVVLYIAASIVETYLRLQQRRLKEAPSIRERWLSAAPALAFAAFNILVAVALVKIGWAPPLAPVAFMVAAASMAEASAHPPAGAKPSRIGIRQLTVGIAFVLILSLGYLLA